MKKSIIISLVSVFVILFGISNVFASEDLTVTGLSVKKNNVYVVKARI